MNIKIGQVELLHNVLLAPMSGVTDLPFRKLVKQFVDVLAPSEMVASRAMLIESKKSLQKASFIAEDVYSCVQLAGCDADIIAEAAKMNEDLGVKIIDLNFGCPAKKIVGSYSGAALMQDIKLATRIFEMTVNAVKIPVTLKMRTGWDENNRNAPLIAKIAYNSGIQMITVHGRTRAQFYNGISDWHFVKHVKNIVKIPVIVNGDINSYDAVSKSLDESNADGIMVGRGVYGRPWLLKHLVHYIRTGIRTPSPSISEQLSVVLQHYEAILEYYGRDRGIHIARKHLGWYSAALPNSSNFRSKINLINDTNLVKDIILEFYNKLV